MLQVGQTIARLSIQEISSLSREDLADIVLAAAPRCGRTELVEHLGFYDRVTLERLAHIARRVCANLEVDQPLARTSDSVQAASQRAFDYFG